MSWIFMLSFYMFISMYSVNHVFYWGNPSDHRDTIDLCNTCLQFSQHLHDIVITLWWWWWNLHLFTISFHFKLKIFQINSAPPSLSLLMSLTGIICTDCHSTQFTVCTLNITSQSLLSNIILLFNMSYYTSLTGICLSFALSW